MQEEIENKTVALIVSSSKFTARTMKEAIGKYLAYQKARSQKKSYSQVTPKGKQTVKELVGQNAGVSSVELSGNGIHDFERIARKYGVDYAVKKDKSKSPPQFLIFFKARDADAITSAMSEFATRNVKKTKEKEKEKPSILKKLRELIPEKAKALKNKKKELEL